MAPNLKQNETPCAVAPGETLSQRFRLGEAELEIRQAFSAVDQIKPDDIVELHGLLDPRIPAITEGFYEHLKAYPNLETFLADDKKIRHLTATMHAYLLGLGHGLGSSSYADERLRVGIVHQRIGLGPTWYLGAHAMLSASMMQFLYEDSSDDPAKLARVSTTLSKLLFFDASLGIHSYHHASMESLEETLEKVERAEAELKRVSRLDGLTGILNRPALVASIDSELERFQRYGHEFTLLFLDFDNFKSINDSHGHGFGDQVLTESVSLIRDSVRSIDVIGRYGGEELVVVLVECGQNKGEITAERIRENIAGHIFHKADTKIRLSVTVSIGVCTPTKKNTDAATIVRHADRAMYVAKDSGRNRTVVYTPGLKR